MEPYSKNQESKKVEDKEKEKVNTGFDSWNKGRVWGGLIVVAVGALLIARAAHIDIPGWVTSPPMVLVAVGLFIGVRHNFRNWFWLIPFGIGVALVSDRIFYFDIDIKPFIWPAIVVAIGLTMVFRPKKWKREQWGEWGNWKNEWHKANVEAQAQAATGEQDRIDAVAVFGSNKKMILSKNFRGGEVVNFFGGTELNLTQADITGPVMLELTQVFGGAKVIVPANWTIHTAELVSVFGGVDDKRMIQPNPDPNKVLILRGTNVFGGIEIKSF